MQKRIKSFALIAAYMGIVMLMLACAEIAVGSSYVDEGTLRLDNGVVEEQDDNGNWVPLGGESTFELTGELEGIDPWKVAGVTLAIRESTQIEEGLEVGGVVRVRGAILEDETWVAYSIELAAEQTDPIIILIGRVDSVDPWVVNGITLNVTNETDIQGDIKPGMIVRVEILLPPDGTWEVLSIASLGEPAEISGCATVIATVLSVNGNEIQFLGWPAPVTFGNDDQAGNDEENDNGEEGEGGEDEENEDENDGEDNGDDESGELTFSADQLVLAVVCVSADGQIVIVQIIVLNADEGDNEDGTSVDGEKVLICHKPSKNPHTISIASAAVPAHLAHGDTLGPCP